MSEYQYLEFRALDRPLDTAARRALRALSSRARITDRRFVNSYAWGDFRGEPVDLLARWFDLHVYWANWGTRMLMLALPAALVDRTALDRYATAGVIEAALHGDRLLLTLTAQWEGGDIDEPSEEDDEALADSLEPVRDELLAGDLRSLYLAWLAGLAWGGVDGNAMEPPPPPGLGQLTPAQLALARFLGVGDDLLESAAEGAAPAEAAQASAEALQAFVTALPEVEKTDLLLRAAQGGGAQIGAEIKARFNAGRRPAAAGPPRVTGEALLAAAERRAAAREAAAAAKQAAIRNRALDELAAREAEAWTEAAALIATRQAKEYDRAVALLVDLLAIAARRGGEADARHRVERLVARKPSLQSRLRQAGAL